MSKMVTLSITLLPRGPLLCARPVLGPGIREESIPHGLCPRGGDGGGGNRHTSQAGHPKYLQQRCAKHSGPQWAGVCLPGELVGKASCRKRRKALLHPGSRFEGPTATWHRQGKTSIYYRPRGGRKEWSRPHSKPEPMPGLELSLLLQPVRYLPVERLHRKDLQGPPSPGMPAHE